MTACAHANEDASLPGGGRRQEPHPANVGPAPPAVREHQLAATSAAYRERAFAHGIPFRPSGLFPPGDPLLARLAADARLRPFEKHLPADASSYQSLPAGGWASGDAAAARGMDLRLFWRPPAAGEAHGTLAGAVRFGDGAGIGTDVWMPAHGGSIETSLDEATAELVRCCLHVV